MALKDILTRKDEILRLIEKHGGHDVRVFGSVAKNRATETSDVDFLVRLDPGCSLIDHVAIIQDLEDFLGYNVDVVPEDALHPSIRQQVLSEAIPL
ncbi:MAG: nucleotidyltransferase family protein [Phycisphaerae bacterium]|nr:nucleotidyltransferase family protein [Phycisphaerae bacterium]